MPIEPADPPIANRAFQRRGGEPQQRYPFLKPARDIPQRLANLRHRPEIMVRLHQLPIARLFLPPHPHCPPPPGNMGAPPPAPDGPPLPPPNPAVPESLSASAPRPPLTSISFRCVIRDSGGKVQYSIQPLYFTEFYG